MKILNQKLNKNIIDELCNSFITEIRQTVMNDRMKVMCSKEKFIKIIIYHDMKILKKENLKVTSEILEIIIKNVLIQTKKKDLIILSSYYSD